jgi:hypothetical protein
MNGQGTSTELDRLQAAKADAVARFLKPNGNIVGIGIGTKQIDGKTVDCVRVYVVRREAQESIPPSQVVAKGTTISGVPVDVIEVGHFGRKERHPQKDRGTTTRPGSPIRVKTDATNVNQGALGTLGAVVTDGKASYVLGCNHVLDVNGRVLNDPKAQVISAEFVGNEPKIADPLPGVPLERNADNLVDCAIARLRDGSGVLTTFPDGTVKLDPGDPVDPRPGMKVTKFGAGTGLTRGTIVDVDANLYVDYSFGTFRFEHQVVIESSEASGEFATNGDSGSLAINDQGQASAMIFAASGQFAVACPLKTVLTELGAALGRPLTLAVSC